jgi:hypothetical protein
MALVSLPWQPRHLALASWTSAPRVTGNAWSLTATEPTGFVKYLVQQTNNRVPSAAHKGRHSVRYKLLLHQCGVRNLIVDNHNKGTMHNANSSEQCIT